MPLPVILTASYLHSPISPPVSRSSPKLFCSMAAPVAGEANLPRENSDHHPVTHDHRSLSNSSDDYFTLSQLTTPKNSHPNSPPPTLTSSLGKRRKSKPVRYGDFTTGLEKRNSPSEPNLIAQDPSSKSSSSHKQRSLAMVRAGEIQSSLGDEHPSYIKLMVKSHVDSGYWMGFPQWFGKLFLPKTDSDMAIEDENGEIHHLRFIADKSGFSAGWKKFAVEHNLLEGDVLVFHLVEPCKFKVYIIRENDLNKGDGALSLLNLEAHTEQKIPGMDAPPSPSNKGKRQKSLPLVVVQKNHELSTSPSLISSHPMEQSGNDSEDFGSEVLEGSRTSKLNCTFQDFHIMVKGVCIDSELPDDVRMNYYKLCIARKEFLHEAICENLYYKLVVGMIGETVNIANEIKNCKLTTSMEEFKVWDNSLKSFCLLGMKVDFLRDPIHALSRHVFELEGRSDIVSYMEAKSEQKRIEAEIETVTENLVKLKEASRKLKGTVDGLKQKAERHEVKFQQEVNNAPW